MQLQCIGEGSRCQPSWPKLSTVNSVVRMWIPSLHQSGLAPHLHLPASLPLRGILSQAGPAAPQKSGHYIPPSHSCLPLQPCKGLCPAANPRPSGLLKQPCWVMEYVLLGFFLWPVQLPLYLDLNGCHLANEPILVS